MWMCVFKVERTALTYISYPTNFISATPVSTFTLKERLKSKSMIQESRVQSSGHKLDLGV